MTPARSRVQCEDASGCHCMVGSWLIFLSEPEKGCNAQ
jgi:hypothetical protein